MIRVTKELAHTVELAEASNGAECARWLARRRRDQAAVREIGGGLAIFAGVDSPITQAFGLGLAGPFTAEQFNELEKFFRERGAAVNVETCPLADLTLTDGFCARGYRPVEFSNVFGREMEAPIPLPSAAPEIEIRPVAAGEEQVWAEVASRGFGEGMLDQGLRAVLLDFVSPEKIEPYLAFVAGRPAGAASMSVQGQVAVVNGAATLPEFRGRGVHTELLRVRLERAQKSGCRLAMVATQVGSAAQRNVERAGFRVLYTRTKWCRGWD